jgi:hypothetical protein
MLSALSLPHRLIQAPFECGSKRRPRACHAIHSSSLLHFFETVGHASILHPQVVSQRIHVDPARIPRPYAQVFLRELSPEPPLDAGEAQESFSTCRKYGSGKRSG